MTPAMDRSVVDGSQNIWFGGPQIIITSKHCANRLVESSTLKHVSWCKCCSAANRHQKQDPWSHLPRMRDIVYI